MHARTELLLQGGHDVPVIKCIDIYVYISQLMLVSRATPLDQKGKRVLVTARTASCSAGMQ